jgi:hypothetical protein
VVLPWSTWAMIATLRNDIWEIRWAPAQPGYVAAQYMNGGPNCNAKGRRSVGNAGRSIDPTHSGIAHVLDPPGAGGQDTGRDAAIRPFPMARADFNRIKTLD